MVTGGRRLHGRHCFRKKEPCFGV